MPDFASLTVSDHAVIPAADTRAIQFRPEQAGVVTVRSTAIHPPPHSELGFLGRVDLRRPGSTKSLASATAHIGQSVLALTYHATAADLATPGEWTCEVGNATESNVTFDTQITYVSTIPLQSASFDVGLLNVLLSQATADAGLRLHLESSANADDKTSFVSWSPAVAQQLKGVSSYAFHIQDTSKFLVDFRLENLDSDPNLPVVAFLSNPLLALEMIFRFKNDTAKLVAPDPVPDIDIDSFMIRVEVGFDGSIRATCDTHAVLRFNSTDVSGDLKDGVESAIREKLGGVSPQSVRQYIDSFFVRLMRLGIQAHVTGYRLNGQSLVVTYYTPRPAIEHPIATPAGAR